MNLRQIFRNQFSSHKLHLRNPHPCLCPLLRALRILGVEYASQSTSTTSCPALPLPSLISPRNSVRFIPNPTRSLYQHLLLRLSRFQRQRQRRFQRRFQRRTLSSIRHPMNLGYSAGISDARHTTQILKIHLIKSATPQRSPRRIRRLVRMQHPRNLGMPHLQTRSPQL